MFSGKTTSLLNEVSKYSVITDKILVVNSVLDGDRYSNGKGLGTLTTHDGKTCRAVSLERLGQLRDNQDYNDAEIIIVDEGQFFLDLYDFMMEELSNIPAKMFIVGGLSGDFCMKPIGDILRLVPLADEIIKLNAYCVQCRDSTTASFTKRIIEGTEQILVGKMDMYIPVCRYHYYNT
jgi:thymidine kinase